MLTPAQQIAADMAGLAAGDLAETTVTVTHGGETFDGIRSAKTSGRQYEEEGGLETYDLTVRIFATSFVGKSWTPAVGDTCTIATITYRVLHVSTNPLAAWTRIELGSRHQR